MARSRVHLFANLLLGLVTVGASIVIVWRYGAPVWLKVSLTLLALLLYPFTVHWLAPKLTGTLVDRLCDSLGMDR